MSSLITARNGRHGSLLRLEVCCCGCGDVARVLVMIAASCLCVEGVEGGTEGRRGTQEEARRRSQCQA